MAAVVRMESVMGGRFGGPELLVILLIVLLLFGASRLPSLARSMGRSARIFKDEVTGTSDAESDDDNDGDKPST